MEMEQIFSDPKDCDILILKNELETANRSVELIQTMAELQGKLIEHLVTINTRLEETHENFTRPGYN
jgi:hypothetical protein